MFSKDEAQRISKEFWTNFGLYMRKHIPLSDEKVKWVNYNTGVKNIYFRTYLDSKSAFISINIIHDNAGMHELKYEQFQELHLVFENVMGAEMEWIPYCLHKGKAMSRILTEKKGLSLHRKDDWKELFLFFEHYLVAFDVFWSEFNELFNEIDQ